MDCDSVKEKIENYVKIISKKKKIFLNENNSNDFQKQQLIIFLDGFDEFP